EMWCAGRLAGGCRLKLLGDRTQIHSTHAAFPAWGTGQQRRQAGMDHHDHADEGVKATGAGDVAVVDAPEDFHTGVDPFRGGSAFVEAFELFGGPRDRRKAPQVQVAADAHRQTIALATVAALVGGTRPALVPRRTTVLQSLPLRFMA